MLAALLGTQSNFGHPLGLVFIAAMQIEYTTNIRNN